MSKFKIAVIDHPLYYKLYDKFEIVKDELNLELIVASEEEVLKLYKNRHVNLALITPLGYASGLKHADFRIVPTNMLSAVGYTEFATMYFKSNVREIKSIASYNVNSFISQLGNLLLSERYNLVLELKQAQKVNLEEQLINSEIYIESGKLDYSGVTTDITEDWFDSFQIPLPLVFWACYDENDGTNFTHITNSISSISEPYQELNLENPNQAESELIWKFDKDIENALEQIMQFLYFRQVVTDIPAIKLIGMEPNVIKEELNPSIN